MAFGDYTRITGTPSPDGDYYVTPMKTRERKHAVPALKGIVTIEPRRDTLDFSDLAEPWRVEQYRRDRTVTIKIGEELIKGRLGSKSHRLLTEVIPPEGATVDKEHGLLALGTLGEYLQEQHPDPEKRSFPRGWPEPAGEAELDEAAAFDLATEPDPEPEPAPKRKPRRKPAAADLAPATSKPRRKKRRTIDSAQPTDTTTED